AVGDELGTLYRLCRAAKEPSREPDGRRRLGTGRRKDQTRYRVEGTPGGPGCRVVFTLLHEDTTEHGHDARERKRGLEMELELARRIDPEAAAGIEAGLPAAKRACRRRSVVEAVESRTSLREGKTMAANNNGGKRMRASV